MEKLEFKDLNEVLEHLNEQKAELQRRASAFDSQIHEFTGYKVGASLGVLDIICAVKKALMPEIERMINDKIKKD
jgi:hypothetical protein